MGIKMKKIIILLLLMLLLTALGCSEMKPSRKNHYFNDTGNSINNDEICFNYCMERQRTNDGRWLLYSNQYYCNYEPIICDNGRCVCKTY